MAQPEICAQRSEKGVADGKKTFNSKGVKRSKSSGKESFASSYRKSRTKKTRSYDPFSSPIGRRKVRNEKHGSQLFASRTKDRRKPSNNRDAFAYSPVSKKNRKESDAFASRPSGKKRAKEKDNLFGSKSRKKGTSSDKQKVLFASQAKSKRKRQERDPFSADEKGIRKPSKPDKQLFTYKEKANKTKNSNKELFGYRPKKSRKNKNVVKDTFVEDQKKKRRDADRVFVLSAEGKKQKIKTGKKDKMNKEFSYSKKNVAKQRRENLNKKENNDLWGPELRRQKN